MYASTDNESKIPNLEWPYWLKAYNPSWAHGLTHPTTFPEKNTFLRWIRPLVFVKSVRAVAINADMLNSQTSATSRQSNPSGGQSAKPRQLLMGHSVSEAVLTFRSTADHCGMRTSNAKISKTALNPKIASNTPTMASLTLTEWELGLVAGGWTAADPAGEGCEPIVSKVEFGWSFVATWCRGAVRAHVVSYWCCEELGRAWIFVVLDFAPTLEDLSRSIGFRRDLVR
uniref:Uncharacterized protein n=1 Tax=Ananas comosus var. bracteatus TaxID=296719 RepID=A0A6V7PRQ2_ANACO|nr:unnamed protein product [Ananas comosus var. bracteatus]